MPQKPRIIEQILAIVFLVAAGYTCYGMEKYHSWCWPGLVLVGIFLAMMFVMIMVAYQPPR